MSDDDKEGFRSLVESVKRIELALTGDDRMGHWGLVRRVDNITSRVKWLERIVYISIGVGLTVSVVYGVAHDWLPHFFNK